MPNSLVSCLRLYYLAKSYSLMPKVIGVYEHGCTHMLHQAEKMLQRLLLRSRPLPTLQSVDSAPFRRGKPQKGFEALVEDQDLEWGSGAWLSAHKTTITSWGRKYVGPHSYRYNVCLNTHVCSSDFDLVSALGENEEHATLSLPHHDRESGIRRMPPDACFQRFASSVGQPLCSVA